MKVIFNKWIPFHGFVAMALYGVVFWRDEYRSNYTIESYRESVLNHESIHLAQMKDFCPFIPIGGTIFYILYLLEWLYRLVFHTKTAYKGISFEVESRLHQNDLDYLKERKHFAMWRRTK